MLQTELDRKLIFDHCRRSPAAAVAFIFISIVLFLFPLTQDQDFKLVYSLSCLVIILSNISRYYWVKKVLYFDVDKIVFTDKNLIEFNSDYFKHRVSVVLNALGFSAIFSLVLIGNLSDPTLPLIVITLMLGIVSGSVSSLALDKNLQRLVSFLLLVVPIFALVLTHWNQYSALRGLLVVAGVFYFFVLQSSKQFYMNMKKRYSVEQELLVEKENLIKAFSKLELAQKEVLNQKSKAEYASKLAALGEMAGGVAHEINNPLTAILGYAEQVGLSISQTELQDKDKLKNKIEKIKNSVQRISRIISGLKNFSRDGSKDPKQLVSLNSIIDETIELCRQRFIRNQVDLVIDVIPGPEFINCRATQISQVILNFLNNALDAVISSEKKIVRLGFKKSEDKFSFIIEDSGPGVPENLKHKIFEPFFTTKDVGKGTGLGLSISKGIIEDHGGTIGLSESELGGAKFTITIGELENGSTSK